MIFEYFPHLLLRQNIWLSYQTHLNYKDIRKIHPQPMQLLLLSPLRLLLLLLLLPRILSLSLLHLQPQIVLLIGLHSLTVTLTPSAIVIATALLLSLLWFLLLLLLHHTTIATLNTIVDVIVVDIASY